MHVDPNQRAEPLSWCTVLRNQSIVGERSWVWTPTRMPCIYPGWLETPLRLQSDEPPPPHVGFGPHGEREQVSAAAEPRPEPLADCRECAAVPEQQVGCAQVPAERMR